MDKTNLKDYLGDSVYADFDGYAFVLTTDNGLGPSNTIVLEPQLIDALNRYVKNVYRIVAPDEEAPQKGS